MELYVENDIETYNVAYENDIETYALLMKTDTASA